MPKREYKRHLQMVYEVTVGDPWREVLRRWTDEWERAHTALRDVDPSDTAEIVRLQERIKLIEEMVTGVEHDVERYAREARKEADS